MFGSGKGASFHFTREVSSGPVQHGMHIGVLLDETRKPALAQSGHILPDKHLGIAIATSPYAHRGDVHRTGNGRAHLCRYHLYE